MSGKNQRIGAARVALARRYALTGLTAAALALAGVAAAARLPDGSAAKAQASATSAAVKVPLWITHPAKLAPGQLAVFVLDPTTAVNCSVAGRQGGSARNAFSKTTATFGAQVRISFRVSPQAAAGRWRLTASCHEGLNVSRTVQVAFAVGGSGGSTVHLARGTISIKRLTRSGAGKGTYGGAGRGGGCDMMGNPFTDCRANPTWKWCTWWAYHQRPDIYNTSIANGAPSGGWDAFMWATYASKYGHFPEGMTPVKGAIAVWTREYFGGPRHDGGGGQYGHVDYVESVNSNGSFTTSDHNWSRQYGTPTSAPTFPHDPVGANGSVIFIYGGQAGLGPISQYVGHIVHWNAEPKPQGNKTAWLVSQDADGIHRNWIRDQATYNCLKTMGAPGPDELPSSVLDQMPDQKGVWAHCAGGGGGGNPPPTPTTTVPAAQPPTPTTTTAPTTTTTAPTTTPSSVDSSPPSAPGSLSASGQGQNSVTISWAASSDNRGVVGYKTFLNGSQAGSTGSTSYTFGGLSCGTNYTFAISAYDAAGNDSGQSSIQTSTSSCPQQTWSETTGGDAHTWTNYSNAGGNEGPTIGGGQTVQIACKLHGFQVSDGNNWWYKIASSPWNGNYYVSADAFYNNGSTSGSLHGTPFVDSSVADC